MNAHLPSCLPARSASIDERPNPTIDVTFLTRHAYRKSPIINPILALLTLLAAGTLVHAADPFAEGVRPTPWLKPEEEQVKFKLPPGFEIQLVAAEPDINKPLNLAFDTLGRLWVTTSIEYPYAAPTNRPGRDRLMIFEDFGPDGRARKVTEFAGGLNIPIGVYPFLSRNEDGRSTWKVVVWSIPNLWLLEDTDGDNKADKRTLLYGPFDHTRDTHGNQASFRRGFDGWLYATHGYNNDSHVKGRDGNQVDLNSGNTYRMRLDGSRLEHYTHGQVNPFGLTFDPQGNLFSSDCHSEPLYQLLAGGYYPSFGKPHDGLGFAPNMMERIRGSTAIDGVSTYADDLWPPDFRGNLFFGDVMTSSVMRDRTTPAGSTLISRAAPDFVATDDPWFRPVDTTFGPDGAMYIADFYNRIIGHYEVPLAHPGRDRTSGRIWRVVFKDKPLRSIALPTDVKGLVKELASPNLTRRMLSMNALADQFGKEAIADVEAAASNPESPEQQAHALWLLYRLGASKASGLAAASRADDPLVRVHAQRLAKHIWERDALGHVGNEPGLDTEHLAAAHEIALRGLSDPNPLVQRCAAEAAGSTRISGSANQIRALLDLRAKVAPDDTHLLYVVRKAIRDQLKLPGNFQAILATSLSDSDEQALVDVALGIPSAEAATLLLRQLPKLANGQSQKQYPPLAELLKHAARYAPENELPGLVQFATSRIPAGFGPDVQDELARQFTLFQSVDDGLQQRGQARPETIRSWGTNLVWRYLSQRDAAPGWIALPYDLNPTPVPWDLETRSATDGKRRRLTSSLPHGESLTGVLRSPRFDFPGQLSFWLCGHDRFPDKPAGKLNLIRLRAADGNDILATAPAPRNDVAQRIEWNRPELKGRSVFVEAVDGDDGAAYAWLAFGGFDPELPQLRPSEFAPRQLRDRLTAVADLAVRVQLKEAVGYFSRQCVPSPTSAQGSAAVDAETMSVFAKTWMALNSNEAIPALAGVLTNTFGPAAYRESVTELLAAQNTPLAQSACVAALRSSPLKSQEKLSYTLASAPHSAETLLSAIENGVVSARVLQRVGVNNRLKASKPKDWEARVAKLIKGLAPADEARERLVAERRTAFNSTGGKIPSGRELFTKNCAACHRIGGEGALIGPQLEGIGQRGAERLCEDILDPNRNVDRAFRSTLITLKDGDVVSGLVRREEGELLVLADGTGKEFTTPKAQIVERRESDVSLMPENFGELLAPADFNDLMAYLLSVTATPAR